MAVFQNNMPKTIIVALGGNAILAKDGIGSIQEQYSQILQTCKQLKDLISSQNRIVITHGNGPQIGNLILALEMTVQSVPYMPFDVCGAATQGFMGYMIQNALANVLRCCGLKHNITTVITEVIVSEEDPAFLNPTKPIGPFYDAIQATRLQREKEWVMIEDSKRGYRRVVPSPRPLNVQQARIIKDMIDTGEIVIAAGGGGIPVVREKNGDLRGIEAVIDKDYASSRLGIEIRADLFVILTAVEKVCRDFGLPSQQPLDYLKVGEAKKLLAEGQFGVGSMQPKIRAAIDFLEGSEKIPGNQPREVIITLPEAVTEALRGNTGTRIIM